MEIADNLKRLLIETCRRLKENDPEFCLTGGGAVSMIAEMLPVK